MPDPLGFFIGSFCFVFLSLLFWKCDSLENGNIGQEKTEIDDPCDDWSKHINKLPRKEKNDE